MTFSDEDFPKEEYSAEISSINRDGLRLECIINPKNTVKTNKNPLNPIASDIDNADNTAAANASIQPKPATARIPNHDSTIEAIIR